ncbi:hypothetical protein L798_09187 [Zootermopsis nevadensis]|uniref:Endonuclease/exonuclease/phosphatase domain-containing protein n=1 Tax=Zootermopsis nevadensis TaxID=136037 RepID=A0A067QGY8_ZOONE|nr:hypothetical protein L798_09187 [Zootermopsis nevadensis]
MQEPYVINSKLVGIPSSFITYTAGNDRKRSAIIQNNNKIDAIMINQLSDEDCVVVEVWANEIKLYAVSIYFDINNDIERDIKKMESILHHANGSGLIIAADTYARSTVWFDCITNQRGGKARRIHNYQQSVYSIQFNRLDNLQYFTASIHYRVEEW